MSRRRGHEEEHENSERWLLSYADFITLLMIFFVVMYAMSSMDAATSQQVKESISSHFSGWGGGDGILPGISPAEMTETDQQAYVKDEVDDYLEQTGLADQVTTTLDDRGLTISFQESLFFESGKADLDAEQVQQLIEIGWMINQDYLKSSYIRVEGYTDNLAMKNFAIKSNWDLSALRASQVTQVLVENAGIDPSRVSIVGYGEYRPKADNATPEGRKENRCVDILILHSNYNGSER